MTSSGPPPHARLVSVGPERLARWLDGFAERHGPTTWSLHDGGVVLSAADASRAWIEPPSGPLATGGTAELRERLLAHALLERRVGVVLVRRSGHAAGLFDGARLVTSKVDSSYVQGTTKAGGWSQQRYARRRGNQTDAAFAHAADVAVRVLGEVRDLDALVAGGDREGVRAVLADRRLAHLPPPVAPWLTVKDPKLKVLEAMPEQFRAVRIRLDP